MPARALVMLRRTRNTSNPARESLELCVPLCHPDGRARRRACAHQSLDRRFPGWPGEIARLPGHQRAPESAGNHPHPPDSNPKPRKAAANQAFRSRHSQREPGARNMDSPLSIEYIHCTSPVITSVSI